MIRIFSLLLILAVAFSACKKDDAPDGPDPIADFSVANSYSDNNTSQVVTMATYDGFVLKNNSTNGDTYLWDFGNGTTSTDKSPTGWYANSGTYHLTLTVSKKDGRKSVVNKTIEVLDRVAKQIVLRSVNAQSALGWGSTYPGTNNLSVWAEILRAAPGQTYPLSNFGVPQAPLVYKTVAANVDATTLPYTFNIADKLIMDFPAFTNCCGYSGLGYMVNLYAQDNTGTFLLASSYGSGVALGMSGDIPHNRFEISTGFHGTAVSVKGVFE